METDPPPPFHISSTERNKNEGPPPPPYPMAKFSSPDLPGVEGALWITLFITPPKFIVVLFDLMAY